MSVSLVRLGLLLWHNAILARSKMQPGGIYVLVFVFTFFFPDVVFSFLFFVVRSFVTFVGEVDGYVDVAMTALAFFRSRRRGFGALAIYRERFLGRSAQHQGRDLWTG